MKPVISVVLPFHDAEPYIAGAVESILAQDFTNFELLAVDDGSSDSSATTVRNIARHDSRVRLLHNGQPGLPGALNTGVAQAVGRYIARMDGDDWAHPERFTFQVRALEHDPRLVAVGSAVERINATGRQIDVAWYPTEPETIRDNLHSGVCCLCHPATLLRRDALIAVGGYRTSVPLAEDLDLWLRLLEHGTLANLDRPLLKYRLHPASAGVRHMKQQLTSLLRAVLLNNGELTDTQKNRITNCTDPLDLLSLMSMNRGKSEVLIELAGWYVANAALLDRHRHARRLSRWLGELAADPAVERRLLESAALLSASRNQRLQALRYLVHGVRGHDDVTSLFRLIIRPPRVQFTDRDPSLNEERAGHVDAFNLHDSGRSVTVTGWFPIKAHAAPDDLVVVVPAHVTQWSMLFERRPDVRLARGPEHVYSGFRLTLSLGSRIGPSDLPRLWVRRRSGDWHRLADSTALVHIPHIGAVEDSNNVQGAHAWH